MGGEVAALIAERVFKALNGPILRVAGPDTPMPYSLPLEDAFRPNAERIVKAARELLAY